MQIRIALRATQIVTVGSPSLQKRIREMEPRGRRGRGPRASILKSGFRGRTGGVPASTFVQFFIARKAQTLAAPRRGEGLGPLSFEKTPQLSTLTPPGRPQKLYYWSMLREALLTDMG